MAQHRIEESIFARAAIVRPVAMLVVFLTVLVLGMVSLSKIPLEFFPSGFELPRLTIFVTYPNGGAVEIEDKICRPLAEAMSDLPALEDLRTSANADACRVQIAFVEDTAMDVAYREVRDRVNRTRPELPAEVRSVLIRKQSAADMPLAFWGVSWDPGTTNPFDKIKRIMVPRLERVPGVASVSVMGDTEREILIDIDRDRVEAAGLDVLSLVNRLRQAHFTLASGSVANGDVKTSLRSVAEFSTKEELEEIVVGDHDLKLRDVALVHYDYPDREQHHRYRGRDSYGFQVLKESTANTRETSAKVKAAVAELRDDPLLAGFDFEVYFDQSDQIDSGLKQVSTNGIQGALMAVVVLFVFLRRGRVTLLIALAIPLSIIFALPVMYFLGQSINLVSLVGLMICTGLVVDNAIVVAENIERWRALGVPKMAAALHGTGEVALAIVLSTATTMVVFLPATLLSGGPVQVLLLQMVTPICVALIGSLFIALVIVPMACVYLLDRDWRVAIGDRPALSWLIAVDARLKALFDRFYEWGVGRLSRVYERFLAASLRRRADVGVVCLVAMASLAIPLNSDRGLTSRMEFALGGRQTGFSYTIPPHVSLEQVDQEMRKVERWFETNGPRFGIDGAYVQAGELSSRVFVFFGPPKGGDPPLSELTNSMFEELPCPIGWTKKIASNRGGASNTQLPINIYGETHADVQDVASELSRRVREIDGVLGLAADQDESASNLELALTIDSSLAQRMGVAPSTVANMVGAAVRGVDLPRFSSPQGEIDVKLRYEKPDREQIDELLKFKVKSANGSNVSIHSLVTRSPMPASNQLIRMSRRVVAEVLVELDEKKMVEARKQIDELLESLPVPRGISFDDDAAARDLAKQDSDTMGGLFLGVVFIFLIMALLFESLAMPIAVLPSIPLSFVGVGWTLYLTRATIDPLVVVGLMLLMGVCVNNAIVLIDFANAARHQGHSRESALLRAGAARFRPILMTSLTTAVGLLPLAVADSPSEGISYRTFAQTLVGGLATSTILTLIVIPVSYAVIDDLRQAASGWFRARFGRAG
jgi:HAE1 family hydrophobic/amphiphilic exporter-1